MVVHNVLGNADKGRGVAEVLCYGAQTREENRDAAYARGRQVALSYILAYAYLACLEFFGTLKVLRMHLHSKY